MAPWRERFDGHVDVDDHASGSRATWRDAGFHSVSHSGTLCTNELSRVCYSAQRTVTVTIYAVGIDAPSSFSLDGVLYDFPPLRGAASDAFRLAALLGQAAPPGSRTMLRTDPAETTVALITEEVGSLLANAQPGDVMGLVLCGHGLRRRDVEDEEEDGFDEVFAASDGPIADDFFREALKLAPDHMLVVSIADACHSDTMTLSLFLEAPPPPNIVTVTTPTGASRIAISACLSEEEALEITVDDTQTSGSIGILTSALSDAWSEPTNRHSYRTWFLSAALGLAYTGYRQHARLRYLGPRPKELDLSPMQPIAHPR